MTELTSSSAATTLTLRVAEARVEDIGHAVARLAPADLKRVGARVGDVLLSWENEAHLAEAQDRGRVRTSRGARHRGRA